MPDKSLENFVIHIRARLLACFSTELLVFSDSEGLRNAYAGQDIIAAISRLQLLYHKKTISNSEKVLFLTPIGFHSVAGILALMALGAVPLLPAAKSSILSLGKLLFFERIKYLVLPKKEGVHAYLLSFLPWITCIFLSEAHNIPDEVDLTDFHVEEVPAHQPALITYTSGSTGHSKAILRSHRVLSEQHQALQISFPPIPQQRDFPLFSNILLHNLALGTLSILPIIPKSGLYDINPETIVRQIIEEKVQTITGNLFYFKKIIQYLKKHPQNFTDMVAIGIGGSPVPESILLALQALVPSSDIYVIYGSSEAEPVAIRKFDKKKLNGSWGYCVGGIHPSISFKIKELGKIKANNRMVSCGEIQVKGKHVVVPDGTEYLNTGDYGYIDQENQLFLTGRKGNEKLHQNVQHYQIEHALTDVNKLEQVGCVSRDTGFDIYVSGKVKVKDIEETLKECFAEELSYIIYKKEQIPVDNRHFSKILYSKIK